MGKNTTKNELVTISEFAKMANISHQAIYKKLRNQLQPYLQLIENKQMLETRALYEVFGIEVAQPIQPKLRNQLRNQKDNIYDILQKELDKKNKQIEELTVALEKEREHNRQQSEKILMLADQSQKLQLAQLSASKHSDETQKTEKPRFLQRFFR